MSKYYSLETLIEAKRGSFCDMYDLEDFLGEIPEEKILKITRCKNCLYFMKTKENGYGLCSAMTNPNYVKEEHFCSYAEQKEIEGE